MLQLELVVADDKVLGLVARPEVLLNAPVTCGLSQGLAPVHDVLVYRLQDEGGTGTLHDHC